jgi:hypothetical protein
MDDLGEHDVGAQRLLGGEVAATASCIARSLWQNRPSSIAPGGPPAELMLIRGSPSRAIESVSIAWNASGGCGGAAVASIAVRSASSSTSSVSPAVAAPAIRRAR